MQALNTSQRLGQSQEGDDQAKTLEERSLEERKLGYVHLVNNAQPQSQTSVRSAFFCLSHIVDTDALPPDYKIHFTFPSSKSCS